jgi:hypothetical protein
MSKGMKVFCFWFILVVILLGILISNFRFTEKVLKAIFYFAKSSFSTTTEVDLEKNIQETEIYKIYFKGKDLNEIYVDYIKEEGTDYQVAVNDQKSPWGKFFSSEKVLVKIKDLKTEEIKEWDITNCLKSGDILQFTYSSSSGSLYLFIKTYQNGSFENNWLKV